MKWAILGLVGLGILAAMSAATLVSSLRMSTMNAQAAPAADEPAEVPVLCAAQSLQPMTVLDGSVVKVKLMPRNQAPLGAMTNPTDVVGKILVTPMTDGEAFTSVNFTSTSPLKQVASVIPAGMRAMGISVTDYAALEGLLYPGSTVDVVGSFKIDFYKSDASVDPQNERSVSTTLLQNIQVLAIEDQTVVSPKPADGLDTSSHPVGNHRITLLVTDQQAKILGLAMLKGTLSLSLRNPLDAQRSDSPDVWQESLIHGGPDPFLAAAMAKPVAAASPEMPREVPQKPGLQWTVDVIRNSTVQTNSFPMKHPPE
jgi:Flp pilus assembly protein CpaB